jgi:2-methylcitrate dehydratase PrpD
MDTRDSTVSAPPLTALLAVHLARVRYEDLPAATLAATRRSIVDTVGVMLAGSGPAATASKLIPMLAAWGGVAQSTVVGHPLRLPAPNAAFANGAMAHQYDFDDTHDAAVAHPTANTLAAGLAVAEAVEGCSGRELLRAIAVGNDIACRFGLAIRGSLYEYAFTRPPIIGIWGATAAAACLLRLDAEHTMWAFGHTLHQTANTLECLYAPGSDVRGLRDGFSARAGVTAAYMAAAGVRGDVTAVEGRFGLFSAYFRGEYDPAQITDGLGTRFEGEQVSIKPWPSARETHATIRAVLELRERHAIRPDDVAEVRLHVGQTNLEFCEPAAARRRPPGKMDALSSLPYAVAVALAHGSMPLTAYTEAGLRDAMVLSLADRVSWQLDEARSRDGTIEGARVQLKTRDGRAFEHEVRHGLGHPDSPLTEAMLRAKFRDCAVMVRRPIADAEIDRLQAAVAALDASSVAAFAAAIPT